MLIAVLNKNRIHEKCIIFSGDNCNTYFGGKNRNGKNNVFTKLKNELTNDLIGIGCPAHILHNSARFGFEGLPIDLECINEKTYNHFSIYTVRNEKFKEFCQFVEAEYRPMLHHSKTRWFSLLPCVQRFLEVYDALKSYFLCDENLPTALRMFFEKPINEAYMWFMHSVMAQFHFKIMSVEREHNSVFEMMHHIEKLKKEMAFRIKEKFLPLKVKQI